MRQSYRKFVDARVQRNERGGWKSDREKEEEIKRMKDREQEKQTENVM